jgi:glutathione synthase/RimK-type ligase-like ATP-grasp enzyme
VIFKTAYTERDGEKLDCHSQVLTAVAQLRQFGRVKVFDADYYALPFDFRSKRECGNFYQSMSVPYPPSISLTDVSNLSRVQEMGFPVVVKEAISSGARGIHFIDDLPGLERFFGSGEDIGKYQIQKRYVQNVTYRFLYGRKELLGHYRTRDEMRSARRLFTDSNVGGNQLKIGTNSYLQAIRICAQVMEATRADLIGIDILFGNSNGSIMPFLLEANLNPQFRRFEEETGRGVAPSVIELVQRM